VLGILNETQRPLRFLRAVRLALSSLSMVFQPPLWGAVAVPVMLQVDVVHLHFLNIAFGTANP